MISSVVTGLVNGKASWKLRSVSLLALAVNIKSTDSVEESMAQSPSFQSYNCCSLVTYMHIV